MKKKEIITEDILKDIQELINKIDPNAKIFSQTNEYIDELKEAKQLKKDNKNSLKK